MTETALTPAALPDTGNGVTRDVDGADQSTPTPRVRENELIARVGYDLSILTEGTTSLSSSPLARGTHDTRPSTGLTCPSELTLSLWDYGGQDVFLSLHHLFLSRYGVYVVVFDMADMTATQRLCERGRASVSTLRFWLMTIAVHSLGRDGKTAPIMIVGTHKDQVRKTALWVGLTGSGSGGLGLGRVVWVWVGFGSGCLGLGRVVWVWVGLSRSGSGSWSGCLGLSVFV